MFIVYRLLLLLTFHNSPLTAPIPPLTPAIKSFLFSKCASVHNLMDEKNHFNFINSILKDHL